MLFLRRNGLRETWPGYIYLLPPPKRRYMPMCWVRAKGQSATLAKIIRFYNLETGNRISATRLAEAMNIRYGRVERAPTFKYRGKPRRLFIRNARIRYGNLFASSFDPWFD